MTFTLLLGGVRSGKSAFAVELGRRCADSGGTVVFVATAPHIDGDLDMAERIERHRADRPAWLTIEEPLDLVGALASIDEEALGIVDCLTLWVSNMMYRGDSPDMIVTSAEQLATAAATRSGHAIIVSNEVGSGVHPETSVGRDYRDLLGAVNRTVAAHAETSLLMVAGKALALSDPWELLR